MTATVKIVFEGGPHDGEKAELGWLPAVMMVTQTGAYRIGRTDADGVTHYMWFVDPREN
jgi:hypothetical protein